MLVETDDTALLGLLQNKSTRNEGFKLIVNSYCQPIYYFLRKMGLDHEAADELLQDIFVKFWRTAINTEHDDTIKITLYRLATLSCQTHLVKYKVVASYGLTSEQLLISILKSQEAFDFAEIAQITSIPVNEVRSLFKNGISKINDQTNINL